MMKEFVFWQGSLSIHQSAFIRNLAASDLRVKLVVWEKTDPQRADGGWQEPDFGRARIIVRPSPRAQSALLSGTAPGSFHIFSGTRGHPFINAALREGLASGARIGIMCEAHDRRGFKGRLRFLRCVADARRFGKRINPVLAMGQKAAEWYTKCGYPRPRIFPFGYFVETPQSHGEELVRETSSSTVFDLIFVAQLIPRKGWDILLKALQGLTEGKWRLHVVGDGVDRERFLERSRRLGLGESVLLHGTKPNATVVDLISRSDLLVLPSRWDGWGAVVNEALMCGVPAICSDRCGAMDLLDGNVRGEVVTAGSVSSLREALRRRIAKGKIDQRTRETIREWSRCIGGESAARYFLAVIEASLSGRDKPAPP
ncbi:MAG TPA: glycosyltransferase, partial [Acidobacteriota bacterium]|nr:glycosyltransferase [Acidobacteriota bacterium]